MVCQKDVFQRISGANRLVQLLSTWTIWLDCADVHFVLTAGLASHKLWFPQAEGWNRRER